MNVRNIIAATALIVCCVSSATAQEETGNLKITFKYKGDAPAPNPIEITQDKAFCGDFKHLDERLIVNEDNNGLKNVVVYAYTSRRGGMKLPDFEPSTNKHTLANENCRFEPRVTLAQVGDTLEVTNPDKVGHNANLMFLANEAKNFSIAPGQSKEVTLEDAEPTLAQVACNIHPWMKGYILAVDHPYFAISDENGELELKDLPVGEVILRAWHEDGTFSKEIVINGKEDKWSKNVFEFDMKPGDNDYGTVEVPANQFRINQQ